MLPTISCPHCRQPLATDASLAGQIVACPTCGKKLRLPGNVNPASQPIPQMPIPGPHSHVSGGMDAPPLLQALPQTNPLLGAGAPAVKLGGTAGSSFRPRQYPAMRVIITICYGMACFVGLSFVLSEILVLVSGVASSAMFGRQLDIPADVRNTMSAVQVVTFLISQVMLILSHGLAALIFVASAESIKVGLDIQQNTQEAAHFARHQFYREAG